MAQNLSAGRMPVRRAQSKGDELARSREFEWLARAGLAARGAIYAIIGVLAVKLAFGHGGKTTDQQGALSDDREAAVREGAPDRHGRRPGRVTRSGGSSARRSATGRRPATTARSASTGWRAASATRCSASPPCRSWPGPAAAARGGPDKATGGVLGWPAGQFLVAAAGVIIIGVGLEQGYTGIRRKFLEKSKTEQMSEGVERAFTALGLAGHLARMVVFALIGYFLIRAAIDFDPDKAVSLDGALTALGHASYGPVLLGVVAAGLLAFAAYSFADARYRRV